MGQGLVAYCDGGVRGPIGKGGNPGFGGFGIHGYLYHDGEVKKEAGNADHVLTTKGYVLKKDFAAKPELHTKVEPIHYIDGIGSFSDLITNNVAEMQAALNVFHHAAAYDLTQVLMVTDSQYVIKGIEQWADNWKKNKWIKSDETEVANWRLWDEILVARDLLRNRGVSIKLQWVKSHTDADDDRGNIGNEIADKYATVGVFSSRQGVARIVIDTTAAQGYWKYDTEKNPLISHRRLYFNTLGDANRPGEYYIGEHGKEDDLLGKRISDGCFAVVQLEKPEPALEVLIQHQVDIAAGADTIQMVRLDHLFRPDTHRDIMKHGIFSFERESAYNLSIKTLDKQPLVFEYRTPMLAIRAVDALSALCDKLAMFVRKDPDLTITDITPTFYDVTEKTDKKGVVSAETKLKPEFIVGYSSIKLNVNYKSGESVGTTHIILTMGMDILHRNALKSLEEKNPKIYVITWSESPESFRFATVVEAGNDRGIFCGIYSNIVMIPAQS